jgi:hypothetical protein
LLQCSYKAKKEAYLSNALRIRNPSERSRRRRSWKNRPSRANGKLDG